MNNIENNICQAIDIIVQRAIAQADYDKTIQATVIECVDQSLGRYKVRYQDSTFYAYSSSSDMSYSSGTLVYVLVPAGNMSRDKTILGSVRNLGANYIVEAQGADRYNVVGENCVKDEDNQTFGLRSYLPTRYVKTLYSKDEENEKVISVNETSLAEYIKDADSIICAATFRTALTAEQQFIGNYGLLIAIDFTDNSTGELITRNYVIDVNKMQGNPYRLVNDTRQAVVFDIDGANYAGVNNISIFCYDFPHSKPEAECEEDIWIKNIELSAAQRKTEEELNGYSISFVTPKGTCFDQNHTNEDTLTIKAQARVKGKVIDPTVQIVDFYWFIEDVNVTSQSAEDYIYYNQYGGQGWRCLNDSNLVEAEGEDERATVQWIPAGDTWTVVKKDIAARETIFKCVAIYNGIVISKQIVIKRLDSQWNVTIVSDQGTQFYFDNGKATLTCLVNNESKPDDYTYCWASVNKDDYFGTLSDTIESNQIYEELVAEYNHLKSQIEAEEVLESANEQKLSDLNNQVNSFNKVTRVDRNIVYNVMANSISTFSVFKCSVYQGNVFLGTGSITLVNSLNAEGVWSVVIHDGNQIFKYNERGVSPAESSNLIPIVIAPLTFTVYDNLGNAIEDSAINAEDVHWIVPTTRTMLRMTAEDHYVDNEDGTRTYSGLKTLPYGIVTSYNVRNQDNDIRLEVDYKGMRLTDKTDFVFTKQGESGTNGSDYICRIVPNCADGCSETPMATMDKTSGSVQWNFTPTAANIPFRVQLWHNDELIFNDTKTGTSTEGKDTTVIWSMLQNRYSSTQSDDSSFTVDKDTGELDYGSFVETAPANILKVEVRHNGVTYYDAVPIITALVNSGYAVKLKKNTGFNYVLYSSDGKKPIYDSSTPFELTVTQVIDGWTEDISLKEEQYAVDYDWYVLGSIVEKTRIDSISLIENTYAQKDLNKNQRSYRAIDTYDGQCVNNAIECSITQGEDNEVARIHMPVYLMLDRYGNSAINGWDGNSVNINEDGGFILAPQMGAGYKETDNSFTGVVMGKVKEGLNAEEVGLFGYYHGQRSIFLDAKTGIARFGLAGSGQIVIDPTKNTAKLYSGNYEEGKGGMLIDLTTPEIKYGNGLFAVDSNGWLTAKHAVVSGGFIGEDGKGWTINADSISNGKTGYDDSTHQGIFVGTKQIAFGSGSGYSYFNSDGTFSLANKGIAFDGTHLTFGSSVTLSWEQVVDGSGTPMETVISGIEGSIPSTDQITQITKNAITTASISANQITGGTITGITFSGCSGEFTGNVKANTGYIGGSNGFTITTGKMYTGTHSAYNSSGSGVYIGTDYISLGSGGVSWLSSSGNFQLGGSSGITYSGNKITLGSNVVLGSGVSISWSQVSGAPNYALKSEIPSDSHITQITNTAISTAKISASQISAGTLSSMTLNSCTGNFEGSVIATSITAKDTIKMYNTKGTNYTVMEFTSGQVLAVGATSNNVIIRGHLKVGPMGTTESQSLSVSGDFQAKALNGNTYHIVGSPNSSGVEVAYVGSHSTTFAVNGTWGGTTYSSRSISMPSSDIRLKANVKDSTVNAMNYINKMRIRQFDWKDSGEHQNIGFIADELEEIDTKLAIGGGYDDDGCMNIKSVNDFYLLGFVVKAIQELHQELSKKESEIAYLKTQVAKIV